MVSRTLTEQVITQKNSLQEQAFAVRQANFCNDIKFFAPGLKSYAIPEFEQKNPYAFQSISLTGSGCALDCDHCNKKILEPMIALDPKEGIFSMCEKLKARGMESVLISGGSLKTGEVPFMKHIKAIRRIKDELGLRIIMHTGLVSKEEQAAALKEAGVDGIALDIIGANETIRDVYHMDATVDDFDKTLALLTKYELSLRPHVILGLHYGKFLGEYTALDMIAKYNVQSLVIVILVPMSDTKMWGVDPPNTDDVAEFFAKARLKMPNTNLMLGCARPLGEYKKIVDKAAVESGINGIAFPAQGIIAHAKTMGLSPSFFENSCSCGT